MISRLTIMMILTLIVAAGCAKTIREPGHYRFKEDQEGWFTTTTEAVGGVFTLMFVDVPRPAFERLSGKSPAWAARATEDLDFPDERRTGINFLASRNYGRRPPYTTRYQQIAQSDPSPIVRVAALRALNRAADESATPVFIQALADQNAMVRVEAAKALAHVPDPNAADLLLRIVMNEQEDKDVRIAAADALRHYPQLSVARALVNVLGAREFAVAWQARRSLITLTGRDHRYDTQAWLNYLTGPDRPFG